VPIDIADELLCRLREQAAAEASYLAAVARGDFSNSWVDAVLAAAGVSPQQPNGKVTAAVADGRSA
jgi:hypothetical protein